MYYRGAVAAVVVYDITDEESYDGAISWIQELRVRGDPNAVIALVGMLRTSLFMHYLPYLGNKLDEAGNRVVETSKAEAYAQQNSLIFMETSAKLGTNVRELFESLERSLPEIRSASDLSIDSIKLRSLDDSVDSDGVLGRGKKCC